MDDEIDGRDTGGALLRDEGGEVLYTNVVTPPLPPPNGEDEDDDEGG